MDTMSVSTGHYAEKFLMQNGSPRSTRLKRHQHMGLKQYNHIKPHQALNMRPSVPETPLEKAKISGT